MAYSDLGRVLRSPTSALKASKIFLLPKFVFQQRAWMNVRRVEYRLLSEEVWHDVAILRRHKECHPQSALWFLLLLLIVWDSAETEKMLWLHKQNSWQTGITTRQLQFWKDLPRRGEYEPDVGDEGVEEELSDSCTGPIVAYCSVCCLSFTRNRAGGSPWPIWWVATCRRGCKSQEQTTVRKRMSQHAMFRTFLAAPLLTSLLPVPHLATFEFSLVSPFSKRWLASLPTSRSDRRRRPRAKCDLKGQILILLHLCKEESDSLPDSEVTNRPVHATAQTWASWHTFVRALSRFLLTRGRITWLFLCWSVLLIRSLIGLCCEWVEIQWRWQTTYQFIYIIHARDL